MLMYMLVYIGTEACSYLEPENDPYLGHLVQFFRPTCREYQHMPLRNETDHE